MTMMQDMMVSHRKAAGNVRGTHEEVNRQDKFVVPLNVDESEVECEQEGREPECDVVERPKQLVRGRPVKLDALALDSEIGRAHV